MPIRSKCPGHWIMKSQNIIHPWLLSPRDSVTETSHDPLLWLTVQWTLDKYIFPVHIQPYICESLCFILREMIMSDNALLYLYSNLNSDHIFNTTYQKRIYPGVDIHHFLCGSTLLWGKLFINMEIIPSKWSYSIAGLAQRRYWGHSFCLLRC